MTELFYLWHPQTESTFSAYGVKIAPDILQGILMVDRPQPVDPAWLAEIEQTFGSYQLHQMTSTGERGIACVMQIAPSSQKYVR